jgi:capsular polysaccharide transport system permease protein
MMTFLGRLARAIRRQISIVLAIADYDLDRKSTGSSLGNWEGLINPMQLMLFFIVMRVGFSLLRGNNRFAAGGSTDMYFNIVLFIASGFVLAFLFRNVAIKALQGLKLRAPLYYSRIRPLDILLALSLNDLRSLLTLSIAILGLVWMFTWSFRFDSPGLAIVVYLLTVVMAVGFGLCVIFLAGLNKWVTKIIKRAMQRVIIFTSGIFFATFELPPFTRPFVTWNPVLHSVELFRYSLNNDYPIPDISLGYLICCSMLTLGFSLVLYKTNESLLLESSDD